MREIVYGKNVVLSVLDGRRKVYQVYLSDSSSFKTLIRKLKEKKIPYKIVSKKELDKFTTENHQGVVAEVGEYEYYELDDILQTKVKYPLLLMLDGIEDPHNLGAIIRTSEACGVSGIILPKHRSAKITETVVKVSTGATEFVKVAIVTNLTETIKYLKKQGYWIVGAENDPTSVEYHTLKYDMPVVLVIGSEGKGISRLVKENCDFLIKIPMRGHVTSLNASVSAAILMYEIIKHQQ